MGGGSEFVDPEIRDPLLPFLREHAGDAGGRAAEAVPEKHGRDTGQVPQQDALDPEMTHKGDGVVIRPFRPVDASVPDVPVGRDQRVQRSADLVGQFFDMVFPEAGNIRPGIDRVCLGILRPVRGKPVPDNGRIFSPRPQDPRREFLKPVAGHRRLSGLFQQKRRGSLRSSQGRHVKMRYVKAPCTLCKQRRLAVTAGRQRVICVIGIAVTDHQDPH